MVQYVRLLTICLWLLSVGCLTWAAFGARSDHWTLMSSQWGLFYSAAAAAGTVWVVMERVNQNISRRNVEETASAVGEAVGRVLREHDRL